jgi:hypothetical protein
MHVKITAGGELKKKTCTFFFDLIASDNKIANRSHSNM